MDCFPEFRGKSWIFYGNFMEKLGPVLDLYEISRENLWKIHGFSWIFPWKTHGTRIHKIRLLGPRIYKETPVKQLQFLELGQNPWKPWKRGISVSLGGDPSGAIGISSGPRALLSPIPHP